MSLSSISSTGASSRIAYLKRVVGSTSIASEVLIVWGSLLVAILSIFTGGAGGSSLPGLKEMFSIKAGDAVVVDICFSFLSGAEEAFLTVPQLVPKAPMDIILAMIRVSLNGGFKIEKLVRG